MSNYQLAKHLGLSEPTLRPWRNKLGLDTDQHRIVHRAGKTYSIQVTNIGNRGARPNEAKSVEQIRDDLSAMRAAATPTTLRVINVVEKWLLAGLSLWIV
jgi:hypothetical protein